jgi:hypothetical protein
MRVLSSGNGEKVKRSPLMYYGGLVTAFRREEC